MSTQPLRAEACALVDSHRYLVERVAALRADLAALTVSARSGDGLVTATVGPAGNLVALSIDVPLTGGVDARTLAARVVEAAAQAASQARQQAQNRLGELLPAHVRALVCPDETGDDAVPVLGRLAELAGLR